MPPRLTPLLLLLATPALAQQPVRDTTRRDTVRTLPGVTVTATRTPARVLTTPLAVTQVRTEALRGTSGYGLDDALAQVPGVLAQSRYGTSDVRLVIRGFGARGAGDRSNAGTSRGVRVLLDGIPETEPDGRTAFDHIDLAAAAGVDVIRSNASSTWGNAAGGVVAVSSVPRADAPLLEYQPIVGGYGLQRHAVRASRPLRGDGALWASFTNTGFDGWRAHSSARRALLNVGATGTLGQGTRVGVTAVAANNLFHLPGPLTRAELEAEPRRANATYAARDERRHNRTVRVGATVEHELTPRTSVSAMLFANPKRLERSERGTYRDFTRYHLGGSLGARTAFATGGVGHRVAVGVDEAYQDGAVLFYALAPDGTRGGELRDNKGEGADNLGVFVQDELQLGARLALLAGARWDRLAYSYQSFLPDAPVRRDRRAFSRVTPKLGASWLLGAASSVYANVGGGVEIPAGNETDPQPDQPPALINPLLDPIRSTTVEVGVKHAPPAADGRAVHATWDVALYTTDVANEIVPYDGGRFYQTAGRARRSGAELALGVVAAAGPFASVSLALSRNEYRRYVVDSTLLGAPGARADYSGNAVVGVPPAFGSLQVGTSLPFARAVRVKALLEGIGAYWADDANTVRVPGYATVDLTAELARPLATAGGWGVRGFVTLQNAGDRRYAGSAFLNPERVGGVPLAFEPGMPRNLLVSLTVGRVGR